LANILTVDDDVAVQGTVKLSFERDNHDVCVASDGLRAFETGDFDLLIVDIFTPGTDGLENMKLVHQQRPDTPIIVISNRPIPKRSIPVRIFLTWRSSSVRTTAGRSRSRLLSSARRSRNASKAPKPDRVPRTEQPATPLWIIH
jgi:CheY-like chemotaxis protein